MSNRATRIDHRLPAASPVFRECYQGTIVFHFFFLFFRLSPYCRAIIVKPHRRTNYIIILHYVPYHCFATSLTAIATFTA